MLILDVTQLGLSLIKFLLKHFYGFAVGVCLFLQVVVLSGEIHQLLLLPLLFLEELLLFESLLLDLVLVLFEGACLLLLLGLQGHPTFDELLLHLLDQHLQRHLLLGFYLE